MRKEFKRVLAIFRERSTRSLKTILQDWNESKHEVKGLGFVERKTSLPANEILNVANCLSSGVELRACCTVIRLPRCLIAFNTVIVSVVGKYIQRTVAAAAAAQIGIYGWGTDTVLFTFRVTVRRSLNLKRSTCITCQMIRHATRVLSN